MSARDLMSDRDRQQDQYRRTRAARRERLLAAGATPEVVAALDRAGPRAALDALLGSVGLGHDPLETFAESHPELRTEVEMWKVESAALERRIASLSVEIHKKFSLPAACVVFVLLGAPLGMRVKRAGPAVAFLSVAFFLFYYLCLVGGEELANRLLLPPWLAMWLPNLVLGALGLDWTLKACEVGVPWRRRRRAAVSAPAPASRAVA